jgi:hypothetical protein
MPKSKSHSEYYVFLSHSGPDTWVASQLSREIRTCGATPFLDAASIHIGARFEEDILAALDRAHELVVLFTPWALDRPYIWAELGAAWARRIPIIALLYGLAATELQSRPGIPIFIKERDFVNLNEVGSYLSQLSDRVASWNGGIK